MPRRILILILIAITVATIALAIAIPRKYISTQTISNPSASTAIVAPSDSDYAIMTIRTAGVHINWIGTATTSNTYYAPGSLVFENQTALLNTAQVINSSDGAAVVSIDFFARR